MEGEQITQQEQPSPIGSPDVNLWCLKCKKKTHLNDPVISLDEEKAPKEKKVKKAKKEKAAAVDGSASDGSSTSSPGVSPVVLKKSKKSKKASDSPRKQVRRHRIRGICSECGKKGSSYIKAPPKQE